MRRSMPLDPEQENRPKKGARKSMDKRVSFGSVSMHMYEKTDSSPTPEEGAARRASLQAARATARQAEAEMLARNPGTPPPPPSEPDGAAVPPSPAPADQMASSSEPQPPPPVSPPASEASDLFFSPMESIPGSPAPQPARLSTLLHEDERVDDGVPALSALLRCRQTPTCS